jgi:hypothetical protein
MLMPVSPERLKLMQDLERLYFLRDTVIPFVKERAKEGKVDLNRVNHACGSPSCLYGWAVTFKELHGLEDHFAEYQRQGVSLKPWSFFGINERQYTDLFGFVSRAGTLSDRQTKLAEIITRKEQLLCQT